MVAKFDYYLSIIAKSKCIYMPSTFLIQVFFMPSTVFCIFHTKYISIPSTSLYQVHLHANYIFMLSTSPYQVHLHTKYIFMSSSSSCQVHLHTQCIFIPSTLYTFIPSTPSRNVHLSKYQSQNISTYIYK